MIPDPEALAANLGADTLVLIVGDERPFLVAVTGSPEITARMINSYRRAGLHVQVAAGIRLPHVRLLERPPDAQPDFKRAKAASL